MFFSSFFLSLLNLFCGKKLHSLPGNYSDLVVTGDDEGIFGVDAQFLYALKPLDREKQPSYSLQVARLFHAHMARYGNVLYMDVKQLLQKTQDVSNSPLK